MKELHILHWQFSLRPVKLKTAANAPWISPAVARMPDVFSMARQVLGTPPPPGAQSCSHTYTLVCAVVSVIRFWGPGENYGMLRVPARPVFRLDRCTRCSIRTSVPYCTIDHVLIIIPVVWWIQTNQRGRSDRRTHPNPDYTVAHAKPTQKNNSPILKTLEFFHGVQQNNGANNINGEHRSLYYVYILRSHKAPLYSGLTVLWHVEKLRLLPQWRREATSFLSV